MSQEKNNSVVVRTVHDMRLHEHMRIDGANILRVPGGWLYSTVEEFDGQAMAMNPVFVPYTEELKELH